MGKLNDIQTRAASLKDAGSKLASAAQIASAGIAKIEDQIRVLRSKGISETDDRIQSLKHELKAKSSEFSKIKDGISASKDAWIDFSDLLRTAIDPVQVVSEMDDDYPILLFPLRLETRFKTEGNKQQLWLRVYPDDCNVVKQEPLMTEDELSNLNIFWLEMARAAGNEQEERGAWSVLAKSHGANRAAWLVDQYKPLGQLLSRSASTKLVLVVSDNSGNTTDIGAAGASYWKAVWRASGDEPKMQAAREQLQQSVSAADFDYLTRLTPYNFSSAIDTSITDDAIIVSKVNLPDTEQIPATKSSWNQAPQAKAMPDRFVAILHSGEQRRTQNFDRVVQKDLHVGLDPTGSEASLSKDDKGIHFNEELKWMVDFEAALQAGMATKIDLTPQEFQAGFDKLYVLGLRVTADPVRGAQDLEALIGAHKASKEGFSLLRQGTPTNNSEDDESGYSWSEDADESYNRIFKNGAAFSLSSDEADRCDGQVLADALGINTDLLQGVPNANTAERQEAIAMNRALFPATLGYFMEEMMSPLFSDGDIAKTRTFFTRNVTGRGPLPAFCIGRQPYGILPVTRFSELRFGKDNLFENRLIELLRRLDQSWESKVSDVSFLGKSGDPHQILLDVLGLHSGSVAFHQRYAQSLQQVYNQMLLTADNSFLAGLLTLSAAQRGQQVLQQLGLDKNLQLPILEKFFLSKPNVLSGPLIDDVPDSETEPVRAYTADGKNYLEWLQSADAEKIRLQNFGGKPVPTALLYLLLRHSLLLSQSDAGTNLLLLNKQIASKKVFHDPAFLHIQNTEGGKSKFEHLYSTNERITGNPETKLIDYIYKGNILQEASETVMLRELLQSLKILEKLPTARLERLLTEHLDCCSYRIDSWKTALSMQQVQQQRRQAAARQKESGLYLGAYGLLLDLRPKKNNLQPQAPATEDVSFFAPDGAQIYTDTSNLGFVHAPSIDQAATAAILRNAYDSNRDSGSKNPFSIDLSSERIRIANDFLEGVRNGQSLPALLGYQFEKGLHDRYASSGIEADKFIYPLRLQFPLVSEKLNSTKTTDADIQESAESNNTSGLSVEAIEARNVVDGLKLIQQVQSGTIKTYPFGNSKLPTATTAEQKVIGEELARLIDINDAIADLLLSEQVFQAVKGNFDKAAAVANAFSAGHYPPEMDVINTPRSGLTLNHKVAVHFDANADTATAPNSLALMTPRAAAEAPANKWLSDLLPDPALVLVKVSIQEIGMAPYTTFVSQKQLKLQPLDLLFSAYLDNDQAMAELDDRILHFLLHEYINPSGDKLGPFTEISILYTEEIDGADKSKVSFFELGTTLSSLRKVLVNRPFVNPATLTLPTNTTAASSLLYDVAEFRTRTESLQVLLNLRKNGLDHIYASFITIKSALALQLGSLHALAIDAGSIALLQSFLEQALRAYAFSPTLTTKSNLLNEYSLLLDAEGIVNPGKATLTSGFEDRLSKYQQSFALLSADIKGICAAFTDIALFDNTLTGIGFIHLGLRGVFSKLTEKLTVVLNRWQEKHDEYQALDAQFSGVLSDAEKLALLQKMERAISSKTTYPVPADLSVYRVAIAAIKTNFDQTFIGLKGIALNNHLTVSDFLTTAGTIIGTIGTFDLIPFDIQNNRNDLWEEFGLLITLREDIGLAMENLATHIQKKLTDYSAQISAVDAAATDADKISLLTAITKLLLREDTLMIPKLTFSPESGLSFNTAFDRSEEILDFVRTKEQRLFPVLDWTTGVARVRENMWHLENVGSLAGALRPDADIELKSLQFPIRDHARWLAMRFLDDQDDMKEYVNALGGDSLLYTASFPEGFDASQSTCGIIIDEWTESVPFANETTGVAFHYDQPNSEPPQTLLLLTPSQINGSWDWEDIVGSLDETLSMARKRAVEPSMIDNTSLGQFLPASMIAVSTHWISVATNLSVNNLLTTND